jgi:hypothetical protein
VAGNNGHEAGRHGQVHVDLLHSADSLAEAAVENRIHDEAGLAQRRQRSLEALRRDGQRQTQVERGSRHAPGVERDAADE